MRHSTLPDVLRSARLDAGLTQEELAARAKVARLTIGRIETGENVPNLSTLDRIAKALGTTSKRLLARGERARSDSSRGARR